MSKQQGPLNLESLRGTIAVVTGAGNKGIGWGICKRAAELGMHVVAMDLQPQLVEQAEAELRRLYPQLTCLGITCDVTRPETLHDAREKLLAAIPDTPIGAVFANAGIALLNPVLRSSVEEWTATLNVNVIGVVNTIHAFVPLLKQQQGESIFCATSSVGGLIRGDGGGATYQASKHAVVALMESLSFELARNYPQLRVHVLCPCIVASNLYATSTANLAASSGDLDGVKIETGKTPPIDFAMTPENHARQVFDQLAAGHFYMVTENARPYVDHDFPFDGMRLIRERMENMLAQTLDNEDALSQPEGRPRSAMLKGPMYREIARRTVDSTGHPPK